MPVRIDVPEMKDLSRVVFRSIREREVCIALGYRIRGHQIEKLTTQNDEVVIMGVQPASKAEKRMFEMMMRGESEWAFFEDW